MKAARWAPTRGTGERDDAKRLDSRRQSKKAPVSRKLCVRAAQQQLLARLHLHPQHVGAGQDHPARLHERLQFAPRDPQLTPQHVGQPDAERAVGFARSRGFRAMRLDTISTSANAIGLYRRLGFRDIDRYDDNPMADMFMELDLTR